MAASIGSTNETFNQSYSNDFDSSEAPTLLGCFKLPVPPAVRRPQTITCAAAGRLESHQRGFWIETLVLRPGDLLSKSSNFFQKKVVGGQPPVNDRTVGGKHNTIKQEDSGLGGWMLRKFQGEPLKPDHVLVFCQASFRLTLSRAGFLTLTPGRL